jgi:hypothetical protein
MVWSEGNMSLKNPVTPPGINPGTIQLVVQRLNHYATPGPAPNVACYKFLTFKSFLLVQRAFFLLNAAFAVAKLDLI